ncbi:hypothetical protein NC652_015132 [Populus alba x Populus x berolinensis]|nr:hypothetical protein NC652_015132 [Populus alba x Populus x berolinensis]
MDPCPFVRLTVGNLALRIPVASKSARSVVHPSSSPCFCKIKLKNFPLQTAVIPSQFPEGQLQTVAATFHLSKSDLVRLVAKSIFTTNSNSKSLSILAASALLVELTLGERVKSSSAVFHLNVKAEPDPRSLQEEPSSSRSWLSSFGSERDRPLKERKGWSITVHDLSGSPVAAASMVTPFVPSPGSDRVSRSNPGSWLILRPGAGTWKPWGRLESWRERGSSDGLGYRFELIPDTNGTMSAASIVLAESTLSSHKGGKFVIDLGACSNGRTTPANSASPGCSPRGSGDPRLWIVA